MTDLAFDSAVTFRWHDEDGRLHVDKSNLTRVQVAPYYGREVPNAEKLGLEPDKIYYGYRPAEELSDPETIRSVVGIPIQLNHHLDYPEEPAKDTRVGATGDVAAFDGTYLSNSLHIMDADACARIRDGSMRQLSLAYHYEPDFSEPGEYKGQHFDFVMRRIRGQHLALVEEGRAGASCIVEDHALEKGEKAMTDVTPTTAGEAPAAGIADEPIAQEIKVQEENNPNVNEKDAKIAAIVAAFVQRGASEEEVAALKEALVTLAAEPQKIEEPQEVPAADDVDPTAADEADAPEGGEQPAEDDAPVEQKPAEDEDCAEDDAPTNEPKPAPAQDAAIAMLEAKFDAIEDCRNILGRVKPSAFDSAGAVYFSALKQLGAPMRGVTNENAQAVYLGFISGQKSAAKSVAQDSKLEEVTTVDLATGINVRL